MPNTSGDLAVQVLQRNAAEFLEHAPGARAGSDPHHVHQMRVATRRMRAALRLFADLLPPDAGKLNDELKWFASQLGPVRDLDVQIGRMRDIAGELDAAEPLEPYGVWLQSQLDGARKKLAKAFESRRFGALVQRLQRLDEWTLQPANNNAKVCDDAPRRLRRAYKQLRKRAAVVDPHGPAAQLHGVRIRGKRLRYTAEFFAVVYGKPAERLVASVVALQDLLGNLQDGIVSREHVHAAVLSSVSTWRVETTLALGQLVQYEAQREKEFREAFPDTYRKVQKAWTRLKKVARKAS